MRNRVAAGETSTECTSRPTGTVATSESRPADQAIAPAGDDQRSPIVPATTPATPTAVASAPASTARVPSVSSAAPTPSRATEARATCSSPSASAIVAGSPRIANEALDATRPSQSTTNTARDQFTADREGSSRPVRTHLHAIQAHHSASAASATRARVS